MRIFRALRLSIRGLFAHRMRAILAVSSVSAGVVAVVVTGAIGQGAKEEVLRQTENIGTNLLVVRPAQVSYSAARKDVRGVVTTLKLDDYQAISQLSRVSAAVPGYESSVTVKAENLSMTAMVLGTTSPYLDVSRFRLHEGRFITDDDDLRSNRVAVLQPQPLQSSVLERAKIRLKQARLERESETRRLEKLREKLQMQLKAGDSRPARVHLTD